MNHCLRRVLRGQKRVEDARKRAYDPRIHLLRKKSFEAGWIAGSRPGNDGSLWFDVNASRFSSLLRPLKALAREVPLLRHDAFISNHKPVIAGLDVWSGDIPDSCSETWPTPCWLVQHALLAVRAKIRSVPKSHVVHAAPAGPVCGAHSTAGVPHRRKKRNPGVGPRAYLQSDASPPSANCVVISPRIYSLTTYRGVAT